MHFKIWLGQSVLMEATVLLQRDCMHAWAKDVSTVMEGMTFEGHMYNSSCMSCVYMHMQHAAFPALKVNFDSITSPFQTWILKRHQQKKNMIQSRSP